MLFQTSEVKAVEITKNRERGKLCLGREGGMGIFAVSLCDDLIFLRPYIQLMVIETKTHEGLNDSLGLSVNDLFCPFSCLGQGHTLPPPAVSQVWLYGRVSSGLCQSYTAIWN